MRAFALLLLVAGAASAQTPEPAPEPVRAVDGPRRLSGPRVGFTVLNESAIDAINDAFGREECRYVGDNYVCTSDDVVGSPPLITQFGWQWERRLFQLSTGTTGVSELVLLVGGAERGVLIPSATFLVGVRSRTGLEFGVGPNIAATSVGYALTVGHTQDFGEVAVPINAAVVLGPDGPRGSLLLGFVVSDRRY